MNNQKPITSEKEIRRILDRLFFETEAAGSVEEMFQLRDIAIMQLDELCQSAYSQGEQATAGELLAFIKKESLKSARAGVLGYDFVHRIESKLEAKYLSGEDKTK